MSRVDALKMVEDWGVVSDGNVLEENVIEVVMADGEVVVVTVAVAADPTTQREMLAAQGYRRGGPEKMTHLESFTAMASCPSTPTVL